MKLLITAATDRELQGAKETAARSKHAVTCAVTGIGSAPTACHTTRLLLGNTFDLAINIGIAGSYTDELPAGSVTVPTVECFADSGVQLPDGSFRSLFDEQLLDSDTFPFTRGALHGQLPDCCAAPLSALPKVSGATVQTAGGQQQHIDALRQRCRADIETMESAAFFYACLTLGMPFVALRAVSNKVAPRSKATWNIPLALRNLHSVLNTLLQTV